MIHRFGPFALDESMLELRRGEQPVELRRQAYDLLAYLVRQQGRVVSKQELFDAVWGGRSVVENALSQCVADIRRALGSEGRGYLRTVHGRGFKLDCSVERAIPPFPDHWEVPPGRGPGAGPGGGSSGPSRAAVVADRPAATRPALSHAVAVLPFRSPGSHPNETRFGQGVSEDLVRCLSSWRRFPVISAGSTWDYAGADPGEPASVAEQLGAQYVAHGSVQMVGDRVRVRAQLDEAATGRALWAGRYDEDLRDFFALQDEVAERIAAQLLGELMRSQIDRLEKRPPPVLDAWQATLLGMARFNRDEVDEQAARHFETAHRRDPRFVLPIFYLGYLHHLRVYYQCADDVETAFERVRWAADQCLAIDPRDPSGHLLDGLVQMVAGQPDAALHAMEIAVERNPSMAEARSLLGQLLALRGRGDEGVRQARLALRLSPQDPRRHGFLSALCMGYFVQGRYEDAARCAEHASRDRPRLLPFHACIASCAGLLGDLDRAAQAVTTLMELVPDFSVKTLDRLLASAVPDIRERFWKGFHIAARASQAFPLQVPLIS